MSETIATTGGLSVDTTSRIYRARPGNPRPEYLGRVDKGVYPGRELSDAEAAAWGRLGEAYRAWRRLSWGGVESIEEILADTA